MMLLKNHDKAFPVLIWAARIGIFLLMLMLAFTLDSAATSKHRADLQKQWQARVDDLSLQLRATILQNIQTVWGLAANVAVQPDINEQRFQDLAEVIFHLAPELLNIGLAPDFTIRYIYPQEGNRAAIGLDLRTQSLSEQQVRLLLDTERAVFSGPIDLAQGGQGLAARIPIHESPTDRFWGVISVILDLDRLYAAVNLAQLARDSQFTLATSSSDGPEAGKFHGSDTSSKWQEPVFSTMKMSGISWTLYAQPRQGWPGHPANPWLFRSLLALMVLVIVGGTHWLTNLIQRDRTMQRRFQGLFDLAPFGIGLYGGNSGKLLRANPVFERTLGTGAASLDFFDRVYDDQGTQLSNDQGLSATLANRFRFSGLEGSFPGRSQALVPLLLHGLKLNIHDSEPVVWIIAEDITERKEVERMKSEFISTVSHELRTPLTSISGSLSLLSKNAVGELPAKASSLVTIALRNSQQLGFLINDLLDIEKLLAGKMEFRIETFPLAGAVLECLENIQNYAGDREVAIHASRLSEVAVSADRQRLAQALNNLLSNAIKFSPAGAKVNVYTEIHGQRVHILVRDHGPGIDPEFCNRIFQKFSQADSSDRRAKGGTGLGLAITRELMIRMGGQVDYHSVPGDGATFWLELPVAAASPGSTAPTALAEDTTSAAGSD